MDLRKRKTKISADTKNGIQNKGENVVVMSLDEYNAIRETLYLNSNPANCRRLEKAIKNMNAQLGQSFPVVHTL